MQPTPPPAAQPLPPRLEDLERETFRSWLDDGLLDMALGLATIVFGLAFFADFDIPGTGFDIPLLAIPFLPALVILGKRALVEPRAGYVRLREPLRRSLKRRWGALLWLYALLTLALFVGVRLLGLDEPTTTAAKKIFAGLSFAIPIALTGPLLKIPRGILHGAVIAMATGCEVLLDQPFGAGWLGAGSTILLVGLANLTSFLHRNPLPPAEVGHG